MRTPRDLPRTLPAVLFIALLGFATFIVLQPFLPAIVWAAMVVIASWPLMKALQVRLWGSRAAAVGVMTLGLLMGLFVPLTLAIGTLIENADQLVGLARSLNELLQQPAPDWLTRLPLVGQSIGQLWGEYAMAGLRGIGAKVVPYAGNLTHWFALRMGGVGVVMLQFLLTVFIAAIMFATGETAARSVRLFARRLGGERGEQIVQLSTQAIRSVALGVGVTALVQALIGGFGLAVAGVPFAALLTALMFMLCIAQLGPLLVMVPAVIWLYWRGDSGWGTALLVIAVIVVSIDNVLRPVLIKRGADLPLLLILAGVVGGLMGFGLVGIFLGPLVLAVSYTLLGAWMAGVREAEHAASMAAAPQETEES